MPGYIHHIEWCVSDLQNQVQKLVSQYGFQPIGQRIRKIQNILDVKTHWVVQQVAVQSGDTIFIITQKSRTSSYENQHIGKSTLCIKLKICRPISIYWLIFHNQRDHNFSSISFGHCTGPSMMHLMSQGIAAGTCYYSHRLQKM